MVCYVQMVRSGVFAAACCAHEGIPSQASHTRIDITGSPDSVGIDG